MKTTLNLVSRNEYQSNTSRWLVMRDGQAVGSVLRRNAPFAEYRLCMGEAEAKRFQTKSALEYFLNN